MAEVQIINNPEYVNTQYQDASNLNARIRLHELFSTNKYGWPRWLFDQYDILPNSRILELGCGAGNLWVENMDRIPGGLEIFLSDFSEGMLQDAQENLGNTRGIFQFKIIDAQSIPFDKNCFDIVIANHMLYHVPDQTKALSEIRRVLGPAGKLYASTIGEKHLKELRDLLNRFDSGLESWGRLSADSFNLENGFTLLNEHFANVSLSRYVDSLIVTDAQLLVEYILSGRAKLGNERQYELSSFVKQEIETNGGKFYITKDSGVFDAHDTI